MFCWWKMCQLVGIIYLFQFPFTVLTFRLLTLFLFLFVYSWLVLGKCTNNLVTFRVIFIMTTNENKAGQESCCINFTVQYFHFFPQGSHKKYNPKLLKESVDKPLELIEQGKLKGPHISGEFQLNQVCIPKQKDVSNFIVCKCCLLFFSSCHVFCF